jgi:hypothetical protein
LCTNKAGVKEMIAQAYQSIVPNTSLLSYDEVCAIGRQVNQVGTQRYIFHFDFVEEITMAALARLVALRGSIIKTGGELSVTGLRGQPKNLYDVYNFYLLLPTVNENYSKVGR